MTIFFSFWCYLLCMWDLHPLIFHFYCHNYIILFSIMMLLYVPPFYMMAWIEYYYNAFMVKMSNNVTFISSNKGAKNINDDFLMELLIAVVVSSPPLSWMQILDKYKSSNKSTTLPPYSLTRLLSMYWRKANKIGVHWHILNFSHSHNFPIELQCKVIFMLNIAFDFILFAMCTEFFIPLSPTRFLSNGPWPDSSLLLLSLTNAFGNGFKWFHYKMKKKNGEQESKKSEME